MARKMEDTNDFKTERRATSATLSGAQTHEAVSLYFLVKTWRLLFPIAFADGCGSDPQGCKSVTTQLSCSANRLRHVFFAFIRIPVEKHARMTPEEANRRLSLTPPAGCRNSFSSCNDGKATSDDLHRKDWDGSSLRAGPAAAPPHLSPSWRGVAVGRGLGVTVEC